MDREGLDLTRSIHFIGPSLMRFCFLKMFSRSATMGAPMSPVYARESPASTTASTTTTAASVPALVNALETTGRLTAPGDTSRNS